ncbi:U3 small nucleolar ribonucleoprotein IMP3 [Halotydeus destructor]|nr:U3 small nucleolar ribonucleoprotein IMP3 [Halotydeus destructor]
MVRKLKYHERKLLKRVDFINWDTKNVKEISIMRKYNVTREEYTKYNKLARYVKTLAEKISALPEDAFRLKYSGDVVDKLYSMGLIHTKRLKKCSIISVKSFCRRRLPVFMVQSGMFNGPLEVATKYVEHGHVRIGPHTVRDTAFLVTKGHEDFITWNDKIKKKIEAYNETRDDYED